MCLIHFSKKIREQVLARVYVLPNPALGRRTFAPVHHRSDIAKLLPVLSGNSLVFEEKITKANTSLFVVFQRIKCILTNLFFWSFLAFSGFFWLLGSKLIIIDIFQLVFLSHQAIRGLFQRTLLDH